MIRFRNRTLEEYSIDPVTAIITNSKGEIQETKVNENGRPCFHCMDIHRIQAHTNYGYKKGLVVHHIDKNKLNNSLSNLVYLTRSEHTKLHNEIRVFSDETKRKMSEAAKGENNHMFRKHHTDEAKQKMSEAKKNMSDETKRKMSESKKGENHPLFGTKFKWINDGIQNRRCPLDKDIPEGFVRGRLKNEKRKI